MDHISTWTNEDVLKWSRQVVRLSQSTIDALRAHNIDGMMLVNWSEDELKTALGLKNVSINNNDWKVIQYFRFQNSMLDLSTAVDLNREMIEEVESSGYPPVDKAALNVLKTRLQPEIQQIVDDFEFACSIQEQDFDPQFYNDLEALIEDMP